MNQGVRADPTEKFRKGADFLFGILIGLSLEEAVKGFLHVAARHWPGDAETTQSLLAGPNTSWLALARLFIFTSVVANFYFGSIKFFDDTYGTLESIVPGFANRFEADVFSGLIHFGLIYTWSLTIPVSGTVSIAACPSSNVCASAFLLMLLAVLFYDIVWLGWRWLATRCFHPSEWKARDGKTHSSIWDWTSRNLLLVDLVIALTIALDGHWIIAELIGGAGAMLLNLWEFTEIVT